MATQELLAFKADTRKGTVELVGGRIFLGGVYAFDLEVDDEPASGYTLAFYLTSGQTTPLCVAACYSYIEPISEEIKNGELRFDSARLRDAFRSVSGANLESLRLTVYLCKGTLVVDDIETTPDISAKGEVKLWWTPVVAMLNGLPIDTKGETGDPGETYIPELYEDGGEVYVRWLGSDGTIVEDEVNIKGPQGVQGLTGPQGIQGEKGTAGETYVPEVVEDEEGAYLIFHHSGGTLGSDVNLKGPQGDKGDTGAQGPQGIQGIQGVQGVQGAQGLAGKSAYQIAVENGYDGTEAEYAELMTSVPENAQRAEDAAEAAETALNNGCVYKVVDLGNSSIIGLQRVNTIYKIAPIGANSIDFSPPTLAANEVIVFWLWIVMGNTAHQLTFPAEVTWLSEGSFAANTETLLAFMSTDGGATWQANLQWEVTA